MKLGDLPFEQFELLGVKKPDIINLPPRTLNALLNGHRTSLLRFNNLSVAGIDHPVSLDAKLSLERKADGKATLKIHPINKAAKNTFSLTAEEIAFFENDPTNFVERKFKTPEGTVRDVMVFLDKITNEYTGINKAAIKAPEAINNVPLTNGQKEDFKAGRPVIINGESYRINPNSEIGLSSTDGNDLKISRIQFRNSSYSNRELALDLALLAFGSQGIVLLEHIANLAFYTASDRLIKHDTTSNISNPSYWDAINSASSEIRKLNQEERFIPDVIAQLVNKHLEQAGIIHPLQKKEEQLSSIDKEKLEVSGENQPNKDKSTKSRRNLKV